VLTHAQFSQFGSPGPSRTTNGVRVAALLHALEMAASIDPAAGLLFEEAQGQRLQGARTVVNRLVKLNALSSQLTPEEATEIAWLFADPALYDRLVYRRGWRLDRFADWLGDALCRELLASRRTRPRRRSGSAEPA
jgi:hypothetical protein